MNLFCTICTPTSPLRGFVREELLVVPEDTQLPPQRVWGSQALIEVGQLPLFLCCIPAGQSDIIISMSLGVIQTVHTELLSIFWGIRPEQLNVACCTAV